MKTIKQIFCTIIVLLLVPLFAHATDVDLGGQHRLRGVIVGGEDRGIEQRFKLAGDFRPNEMFESHFWLMTNHRWRSAIPHQMANTTSSTGVTNVGSGPDVVIYGYADWKVMDEVMLRFGRNPFQIADGSTVGWNDYESLPNVWDGVFLTYNTESLVADIWAASPSANPWVSSTGNSYHTVFGVSLNVRAMPEFMKTAQIFAMYVDGQTMPANVGTADLQQPNNPGNNHQHIRVGGSVGGNYSSVEYNVSGAGHGDEAGSLNQYFVDGGVGYTVNNVGVRVRGHYESSGYDPFYYTRHNRSGLLDVVAWGNGAQFVTGNINYTPMDDFDLGVKAVYFLQYQNYGQWANNTSQASGSPEAIRNSVTEIAGYVKKSYAGGLTLKVSGGMFDILGASPLWQVQVNTTFDF